MIIQRSSSGTLAIMQEDHAQFAGFLLEHWTDHNFQRNPDRGKIVTATCEHDYGWRKLDAAPRIDPRKHIPVDFSQVTAAEAHDIWTRAAKRYIADEPFIALLITHHAYAIHEHGHKHSGEWKSFFIEFAHQRATLRDQLGMTQNEVEHPYSFLRMADWLSLTYCMHRDLGKERPEKYAGYGIRRDGDALLIRPYPFDTRDLTYRLPVYPMKKGGYEDEKELRAALKKPEYRDIVINPLESWS